MSTPILTADAFVETQDTPRKLSGRSAERSPYFDLLVSMIGGNGRITPKSLTEEDAATLMSDLRTALRQVVNQRKTDGQDMIYLSMRKVLVDPKTSKPVRKGHVLIWFRITDQPGRKTGPRVDRANQEAPADAQPEQAEY